MQSFWFLELLALDERIPELYAAKMKFYWCKLGFTLPIPLLSLIFFEGSIGLNTVNLSIDVLMCGKDNPPAPHSSCSLTINKYDIFAGTVNITFLGILM